jgi:hypothetical protein
MHGRRRDLSQGAGRGGGLFGNRACRRDFAGRVFVARRGSDDGRLRGFLGRFADKPFGARARFVVALYDDDCLPDLRRGFFGCERRLFDDGRGFFGCRWRFFDHRRRFFGW